MYHGIRIIIGRYFQLQPANTRAHCARYSVTSVSRSYDEWGELSHIKPIDHAK